GETGREVGARFVWLRLLHGHSTDRRKAMLWNIIDNRERKNRWACVDAIAEPTMMDNKVHDADQAPAWRTYMVETLDGVSLEEAILWAQGFDCPTTLFLYDGERLPWADEEDE